MAEETIKVFVSVSRIDNIDKLKDTFNYLKWKEEFEDILKILELWHYILIDNVKSTVGGAIIEAYITAWTWAHNKICILIKSRCEKNSWFKIKIKINAKNAWIALKDYKLRGFDILNFIYKKFMNLTLIVYDNESQTYIDRFVEVLEEVEILFKDES